jgi:L-fuconolactonase
MAVLRRDYLPADLEPHLRKNGFDGTVVVQADQSEAETAFLLDLASRHSFIRGVVGWVDLQAGDVDERLARAAASERLVGVRHIVQSEPDPRFLLRRQFLRGVRSLQKHGLTYDLLIYPHQLPAAYEFVKAVPDQPVVIDHLAKPQVRHGQFADWRQGLERLAGFPGVHCKLSGLVTEAEWEGWRREEFTPYLDAAWELFGEDRTMIGSDWPVCLLSASYGSVIDIVSDFLQQFDADVQAKVLGENCARFYGLS